MRQNVGNGSLTPTIKLLFTIMIGTKFCYLLRERLRLMTLRSPVIPLNQIRLALKRTRDLIIFRQQC